MHCLVHPMGGLCFEHEKSPHSPINVVQPNVGLAIERMVAEVLVMELEVHVQAFAAEMERATKVGYDALAVLSNLRLPQPLKPDGNVEVREELNWSPRLKPSSLGVRTRK